MHTFQRFVAISVGEGTHGHEVYIDWIPAPDLFRAHEMAATRPYDTLVEVLTPAEYLARALAFVNATDQAILDQWIDRCASQDQCPRCGVDVDTHQDEDCETAPFVNLSGAACEECERFIPEGRETVGHPCHAHGCSLKAENIIDGKPLST